MKTVADVEKLCALMVKYGLTQLSAGGVNLVRPPSVPVRVPIREEPAQPTALDRLHGMSPLEQDAALMLGRLDQ